jgi:hypothetical protein
MFLGKSRRVSYPLLLTSPLQRETGDELASEEDVDDRDWYARDQAGAIIRDSTSQPAVLT